MEISTVKDAFDRVAKKQKLSSSKSQQVIDQVGQEIEQAITKVQSLDDTSLPIDLKSFLAELNLKLSAIGTQNQLEGSQKESNSNLSKYLKLSEAQCDWYTKPVRRVSEGIKFKPQQLLEISIQS